MDIAERLNQLAHAAAKSDWREFDMRVPAEPDRDADLVLLEASKLIPRLRAEVERLREFVREIEIAAFSDETGEPDDAESVWMWLRGLIAALRGGEG